MFDLDPIKNLPGVVGVLASNKDGELLEAIDETDGEAIAAILGVVIEISTDVGTQLGLLSLQNMTISTDSTACIITITEEVIITTILESAKTLANTHKKIDIILNT